MCITVLFKKVKDHAVNILHFFVRNIVCKFFLLSYYTFSLKAYYLLTTKKQNLYIRDSLFLLFLFLFKVITR